MRFREEISSILDPRKAYALHRQGFAEAMDARFFTIEWLDQQVEAGVVNVWGTKRAAIIAALATYPTGIVTLEGMYATGKLPEIVGLIEIAEAWGRHAGADFAFISSRDAWTRIAPGYSDYKRTIIKELR
jgi:hypothetical protein